MQLREAACIHSIHVYSVAMSAFLCVFESCITTIRTIKVQLSTLAQLSQVVNECVSAFPKQWQNMHTLLHEDASQLS